MKKNIIIGICVVILAAIAYLISITSYRFGYANGTKNQIICQASESQESLKQLCVR